MNDNTHADSQAHGGTHLLQRWLRQVYAGDVAGGFGAAAPHEAAALLADHPGLVGDDPLLACAVGDEAAVRRAIEADPGWANRPGGPLQLPPLGALAHSSLLRLPAYQARLHACARQLLDAGAHPDQHIGSRCPPDSLAQPSTRHRLSALYGAAGRNRDPVLTRMLLEAGANPNDGESLYHALESPDCTRLLLEAGARVSGTQAMYRVLDLDQPASLRLLLQHGADANEPPQGPPVSDWGSPLLWAIRRRCSVEVIDLLLQAGADPLAVTPQGVDAATLAHRFGLPEVAARLADAGVLARTTPDELWLAACARGDEARARALQHDHPELPGALQPEQLRMLPELAALGCRDAVACMVKLGWPIDAPGGDWQASALNQAVFRGDPHMAALLLAHGARWTAIHGYGDNCRGTLAWASCNRPVVRGAGGDWLGCARLLVAHGMPMGQPDPQDPQAVLVGGARQQFSPEVTRFLLGDATG